MKTDTLFYKIFKEFPTIFFELIGRPETNTKALSRLYARAIKQ